MLPGWLPVNNYYLWHSQKLHEHTFIYFILVWPAECLGWDSGGVMLRSAKAPFLEACNITWFSPMNIMLASSNMVPPLINKSYTEVVAICTDASRWWADRRSWARSPVLDTDRLLPRLSSWLDTFNSCEGPFIQIQTKQKGSFVAAFSRSEFKPTTYKSLEQQLRTCLEESKIKIIKEQGGAREDWLKDIDTHKTGSGVIEELSFSWTPEPCPLHACVIPTLLCCWVSINNMRDEITIMSPQSWTLLSQSNACLGSARPERDWTSGPYGDWMVT